MFRMEEVSRDQSKTTFKSGVGDSFFVCEPLLHFQLLTSHCSYSGTIDGFKIGETEDSWLEVEHKPKKENF